MTIPRREFLRLIAGAAVLQSVSRIGRAQNTSAVVILAPTGKLRTALIASNPVLVTRRPDGTLGGVSVAVAHALAAHLSVPIELKPYDNPARYNESLATDDWDIGLAARDPARADHLALSATFMEVDNGYVARPGAPPTSADEVDRPGIKIAVAQGVNHIRFCGVSSRMQRLSQCPVDLSRRAKRLQRGMPMCTARICTLPIASLMHCLAHACCRDVSMSWRWRSEYATEARLHFP